MPLTIDELGSLTLKAYLCDGESSEYFEEDVVPTLADLSQGELWAFAGILLTKLLPVEAAKFVAEYALRVSRSGEVRPTPQAFSAKWDAKSAEVLAICAGLLALHLELVELVDQGNRFKQRQ
jgi:hypothetical protein